MSNEDLDSVSALVNRSGSQPQVCLQPIAAPSILGLYGLAGATFVVAAQMAHWFGSSHTTLLLVPFAAIFGGLAQFLAGMWAYRARDGVATAVHGMWGAFWMAFGVLALILSSGRAPTPAGPEFPALGYWFIVLAAITWVCTAAAAAENKALVTVLAFLAGGSTISAISLLAGNEGLLILAGYSDGADYHGHRRAGGDPRTSVMFRTACLFLISA